MAVDVRLTAIVLVLISPVVLAQERCSYMTAIPREPRPVLPDQNFDGLTWNQRPLIPADDREDVCMDGYHVLTPTLGSQIIYMDEEIEGDVSIAELNYDGPSTPFIESPFVSGSFNLLMPVIRRVPANGGRWHLVITQRQDFETPGMQQYVFNVRVDDQPLTAVVSLQIVNIDDNDPIIHNFGPCIVPELGEPGLTQCVYNVSDVDGRISTEFMQFRIDSDRSDNETFYIRGDNVPNQWMWMNMTIGLNASLNFETNPLHIFSVTALDSLPNTHTVAMMVQVENVNSRPPRWLEIFAVQQFDEKTSQSFTVRAIDGDTGIDMPINYRLETAVNDTFFSIETLPGGRSGAIFRVAPIDRDFLQREVFQLTIVAYKYDNETFSTPTNVVIIVNDINDQIPEPLQPSYHLAIMEETPMTLNFDDEFGFHDRDLGQNAQYEVHLESVYPPGAAEAFYIAPEVGYQRQTFIMGTLNHSVLDYEVPEFQHITLRVVATDMNNNSHVGVAMVNIDLINWNDEEPIFESSVHTVYFNETEGAGFQVATVLARDRDIGDRVQHSLLGNAVNFLSIDEDTGQIHVSVNDSFDYHRQSELFVQVRATDTLGEPYHTATSQLNIQLLDINNTPPTLRLPRGSPQVEENVPEGFVISEQLRATDPDTTAELRFEINWETSYATKQGRETDPVEFVGCVEIQTIYPEVNNRGLAVGRVVVREIRHNVTIDYEEFEMLYLTVRVRDLNTVYGDDYDESTFTITIIDMNDNPPVWAAGTLAQELRVRETSASGVVIGSVLATDIDGPLYNQVRYTIRPREDTDEGLVMIDFLTGQLSVNTSGAIDADTPPRHHLYYTVVASDRCSTEPALCPDDPTYWDTEGNITIFITDTNNKVPYPQVDRFPSVVYIYENATNLSEVVTVAANDLDRDAMYHTVSYQINYAVNPRLRVFFSIERESGLVYVDFTSDEVLDRDGDEPTHRIFLNLFDNFFGEGEGNRNQNDTEVLVVLLDVNDNAPELPPPHQLSWSISENLTQGIRLQPDIYAPDRDEPDTDNSRVGYAILNLSVTDRDLDVPQLFNMVQIANVTGELETAMDLRGYWGTYAIHILAFDHGIPQQSSNETYELVVRPFNFHSPEFVFPRDSSTIRLARERAVANGVLATVDGEFLGRISATDEDGLNAGLVTFQVVGDGEAEEYFQVMNDGENLGTLMLLQMFPEDIREFTVQIQATDQGTEPGPRSTDCSFRVVFVPTQGEPTFTTAEHDVAFIEKEAGMSERHQLPRAEDAKNHLCEDDCYDIYYRIIDGNSEGHFGLDPVNNVLFLERELDRNESQVHTLLVAASNSPTGGVPLAASVLTITVVVREADPRPIFTREVYTAGISTSDSIGRDLLTLHATHSEGAAVTYTVDMDTMVVDPTLEGVRQLAFVLNPQTGVLTLNIQPTASMHGMFHFQVIATDTEGAEDRAQVTVYIVSSQNRVFFVFINTLQQVEANKDFIADTFTAGFNMVCNIDQVVPASDSSGVPLDYSTEVRGHFIRNNVPVLATEIEQIRSDLVLLSSIQTTLASRLLVLQDLLTGSSPDAGSDPNQMTVYVLAALSALLGFMSLVLLLTFIIRTRALNRRLEALSMTKYGSMDSGLNRAGIAAPGTNKHTVEGSNPIFNEAIKTPDLDAISDGSNDSDLIGIEDLPHFSNYLADPDTTHDNTNGMPDSIANHNNNFAFNPTPFTPGFANGQFRRI